MVTHHLYYVTVYLNGCTLPRSPSSGWLGESGAACGGGYIGAVNFFFA